MIESRSGGYDRVHGRARCWTAASGTRLGKSLGRPCARAGDPDRPSRSVRARPGGDAAQRSSPRRQRGRDRRRRSLPRGRPREDRGDPGPQPRPPRDRGRRHARVHHTSEPAVRAGCRGHGSRGLRGSAGVLPLAPDLNRAAVRCRPGGRPRLACPPPGPPGACGATERADQAAGLGEGCDARSHARGLPGALRSGRRRARPDRGASSHCPLGLWNRPRGTRAEGAGDHNG